MELSATEAVQRHIKRHVVPPTAVSQRKLDFEHASVDQQNLGYLSMIEWFVDSFIGIVIWAALDPANPFISLASAPFVIGVTYANTVLGFAGNSISTNLARDLGTRVVPAIFYGREAFSYLNNSWIAILVNIPPNNFATAYYGFLISDSPVKIGTGHAMHEQEEEGLRRHITNTGIIPEGSANMPGNCSGQLNEYVLGKRERGYDGAAS